MKTNGGINSIIYEELGWLLILISVFLLYIFQKPNLSRNSLRQGFYPHENSCNTSPCRGVDEVV